MSPGSVPSGNQLIPSASRLLFTAHLWRKMSGGRTGIADSGASGPHCGSGTGWPGPGPGLGTSEERNWEVSGRPATKGVRGDVGARSGRCGGCWDLLQRALTHISDRHKCLPAPTPHNPTHSLPPRPGRALPVLGRCVLSATSHDHGTDTLYTPSPLPCPLPDPPVPLRPPARKQNIYTLRLAPPANVTLPTL